MKLVLLFTILCVLSCASHVSSDLLNAILGNLSQFFTQDVTAILQLLTNFGGNRDKCTVCNYLSDLTTPLTCLVTQTCKTSIENLVQFHCVKALVCVDSSKNLRLILSYVLIAGNH